MKVMNGGDHYLRNMLLWAALCPLGDSGSVDGFLRPRTEGATKNREARTVYSFGVVALLLQVTPFARHVARSPPIEFRHRWPFFAVLLQTVLLYVQSAWTKVGPEWRDPADLSAVALSLNIDVWVKPFGVFLRDYPALTRWRTHCTALHLPPSTVAQAPLTPRFG